jgi:hypothetical protein
VPWVIPDAGQSLDHRGNSRQRPKVCRKAMSLRPATQRGIQLGHLPSLKPRLTPCAPRALERLDASLEETEKPPAYALTADPK